MHDNDKVRFATLLTGIADYYRSPLASAVIELYWQGLRQFDIEAVEQALWRHTQTTDDAGKFMPKIADLKQMLQGTTADQASIAWTKVDTAVRTVGTHRDVVFDDGLIHRVIAEMGGWIQLGMAEEKEWPFIRNQFQSRYRGYRMRSETPEYAPVLIGISNAHNGKQGFAGQEPVLIGNGAEAKRVMLGGTTAPLIAMRQLSEVEHGVAVQRLSAA
ncbi:DUF6475 domain-containing protein [Herbaspirillum robiniae]|uniref:DUF6475 domain-containing protein n=1 Tax=Herbaspirillum robiniae TaxID=2014887 RepID=UPI0009A18177|nr:DUF6475 domain-containing protein [Herbaspirillum robiniae]